MEKEARAIGLKINEDKIKYMKVKTNKKVEKKKWNIRMEGSQGSNFEEIDNFIDLGVESRRRVSWLNLFLREA